MAMKFKTPGLNNSRKILIEKSPVRERRVDTMANLSSMDDFITRTENNRTPTKTLQPPRPK